MLYLTLEQIQNTPRALLPPQHLYFLVRKTTRTAHELNYWTYGVHVIRFQSRGGEYIIYGFTAILYKPIFRILMDFQQKKNFIHVYWLMYLMKTEQ